MYVKSDLNRMPISMSPTGLKLKGIELQYFENLFCQLWSARCSLMDDGI